MHSTYAQSFEQKTVSIYFPSNGDQLNAEAKSQIRKTFLDLNEYLVKQVYVEGHTDSDASMAYNVSLATRRADNTKDFLLSQGIKSDRIFLESFGEMKPISGNKAQNRRVQITIVYEIKAFDENILVKQGDARIIQVSTFHANTRKPLPCSYVVEKRKRNRFANTNAKAVCYFDRSKYGDLDITFSKHGFLNESVSIHEKDVRNTGDTLQVKVYLKPVEVVQKLRFDHIYFYTDTDNFKPESKPELEKMLTMLKEFPSLYVEIQGHMNFSETRQANVFQRIYNHDLSHKRARAVYDFLVSRGIDKKRLTYKGLSNFRMIFPNPKTAEEADQNKRVEVWTLQLVAEN
ncbi:MAG: OmpA family protein [Bacteroidia bacterium]|nr:OmpA family protein [Bacteroidia bacterium]